MVITQGKITPNHILNTQLIYSVCIFHTMLRIFTEQQSNGCTPVHQKNQKGLLTWQWKIYSGESFLKSEFHTRQTPSGSWGVSGFVLYEANNSSWYWRIEANMTLATRTFGRAPTTHSSTWYRNTKKMNSKFFLVAHDYGKVNKLITN